MPTTETPIYNEAMDAALSVADDHLVEVLAEMDSATKPKKVASGTAARRTIDADGQSTMLPAERKTQKRVK